MKKNYGKHSLPNEFELLLSSLNLGVWDQRQVQVEMPRPVGSDRQVGACTHLSRGERERVVSPIKN